MSSALPTHIALQRAASPLGPAPVPSEEDYAAAARFVDEEMGKTCSASWIERNRDDLVRSQAEFERRVRLRGGVAASPGEYLEAAE